jgi:hypothetical protein
VDIIAAMSVAIAAGVLPWDVLLSAAQDGWGVVARYLVLCVVLGAGYALYRDRHQITGWLLGIGRVAIAGWAKRKKRK